MAMMRGGDDGLGSGNDGGSGGGGGGAVARVQGGNAGSGSGPGRGSGAAGPGRASRAAYCIFFERVGQNDVTHCTELRAVRHSLISNLLPKSQQIWG